MMPLVPIVAVSFSVLVAVGGTYLYVDLGLPIWLCASCVLPVLALGVWLDSHLQKKALKKIESEEKGEK